MMFAKLAPARFAISHILSMWPYLAQYVFYNLLTKVNY